jgi:hypothetical protein
MDSFGEEVTNRLGANEKDRELLEAAATFMAKSTAPQYSYNFSFLGRLDCHGVFGQWALLK